MQTIRYLGLALLLVLAACQQQPPASPGIKLGKPYAVDGKTYYPAYDPSYDKIGVASWYGPGFHGKYTASGEVFNQNDLTAAHPTLPMPSLVRVTNLQNGKSLIVRINDRGPFAGNRIIDLSKKSAHMLGISSIAQVRVQFLKKQTDEYVAQVEKTGRSIDMAQLNDDDRARREAAAQPSQIVEADDASTHAGQPIDEAAPVVTVSSDNLASQAQSDHPEGTNLSDSSGQPVGSGLIVHNAWANDNVSLPEPPPSPEKSQPVKLVMADGTPVQSTPAVAHETEAPKAAFDPPPAHKKHARISEAVAAGGAYLIQAGAFSAEANAQKLSSKLEGIARTAIDKIEAAGKTWWRVRLGPFTSREEAAGALEKVRSSGLRDAHIVHSL